MRSATRQARRVGTADTGAAQAPIGPQNGAQRVWARLDILPPSANHIYRSIGGARKALTDEVLTFRHEVALAVRGQAAPAGPLVCTVRLTFGTKRRQDADNRLKALGDALALALDFDDRRIVEWHVYAAHGATNGCDVTLEARP